MPFALGGIRWFYDVPGEASWTVSKRSLGDSLVAALSGSFAVSMSGRHGSARVTLNRASTGLHVPARATWGIEDVSTNAVGLVLSSPSGRPVAGPDSTTGDESRRPFAETTIDDCGEVVFRRHRSPWGSTTEVIPGIDVPFAIPRVYYLYDIPGGASRGAHGHRALEQVLVAVTGSFEMTLSDGRRNTSMRLDRADIGTYVPPGIWRELTSFSTGAVCVTLASAPYDEGDYVRDYAEFSRLKRRSASGAALRSIQPE